MSVLARVARVARSEGYAGILLRLKRRWTRIVVRIENYRLEHTQGNTSRRSVYGILLTENKDDKTFQFYVDGAYGFFLFELLSNRKSPFYFIDVGANQGLYAIVAARNPSCIRAFAFEPVPNTADLLDSNIKLNAASDKVEVHRVAISADVGPMTIQTSEQHSGAATLRAGAGGDADRHALQIMSTNVSGLDALDCRDDVPILVKIDVEGHELVVLSELVKSKRIKNVEQIFYECGEDWIDPEAAESLLRDVGFRRFDRIGTGRHYDVLAAR